MHGGPEVEQVAMGAAFGVEALEDVLAQMNRTVAAPLAVATTDS